MRHSIIFEHGMKFPQIISLQVNKLIIDIVQDGVAVQYLAWVYPARHILGLESHPTHPYLGPRAADWDGNVPT